MTLVRPTDRSPLKLQLSKNLVRSIKRGHPWVFDEALRTRPQAPAGTPAILLDNRGGREIGRGFYDPSGPLALRLCTTQSKQTLNDAWAVAQMRRALDLRQIIFSQETTSAYRLVNGEGDGLPGLVCDRYQDTAVLAADGEAARKFWDIPGIAHWLADQLNLNRVYERYQDRNTGRTLIGAQPETPIHFIEHGLQFTADIVFGQKTGFFLDQRQNRRRMAAYCRGKRVLNLFSYTGGFSVYAGAGGATHVTSVDSAQPALDAATTHWLMNGLTPESHLTIREDAFSFLESARQDGRAWDCVIIDPPSFAHAQEALPKALSAYQKLAAAGSAITAEFGILALSSCSSHVNMQDFIAASQEGISQARKQARLLEVHSQPPDHPAPLAMPEFRYLKFLVLQINS